MTLTLSWLDHFLPKGTRLTAIITRLGVRQAIKLKGQKDEKFEIRVNSLNGTLSTIRKCTNEDNMYKKIDV